MSFDRNVFCSFNRRRSFDREKKKYLRPSQAEFKIDAHPFAFGDASMCWSSFFLFLFSNFRFVSRTILRLIRSAVRSCSMGWVLNNFIFTHSKTNGFYPSTCCMYLFEPIWQMSKSSRTTYDSRRAHAFTYTNTQAHRTTHECTLNNTSTLQQMSNKNFIGKSTMRIQLKLKHMKTRAHTHIHTDTDHTQTQVKPTTYEANGTSWQERPNTFQFSVCFRRSVELVQNILFNRLQFDDIVSFVRIHFRIHLSLHPINFPWIASK